MASEALPQSAAPEITVEEVLRSSSSSTIAAAPSRTETIPFACAIPSDMSFVPPDPDSLRQTRAVPLANAGEPQQEQGIVGTITRLGDTSVLIWFGWGDLAHKPQPGASAAPREPPAEPPTSEEAASPPVIGLATNLIMGPLVVGMPRNKYKGAFSEETSPVSKLVGSSDDVGGGIQNTRIASLVADRLSHRLKLAVFVSCNLEGQTPAVPGCDGVMEQQMLRSRAGALAEREIGRILEEKLIKA